MVCLDELIEFARITARNQKDTYKGRSFRNLFVQVTSDYDYLVKFYRNLSLVADKRERLVPASEWFLDNFHIISEHVKEIEYNLPRGYYKNLPILKSGKFKDKPRIYAIAVDIVLLSDGKLEEEVILTFLENYQAETPLTIGELWAAPFMIRIALINKIREVAEKVEKSQNHIKKARLWSEKFINAIEESDNTLNKAINEHDKAINIIESAYGEHILHFMREYGTDAIPVIKWFDKRLALQGTNADKIIHDEHQNQTSLQVFTGNLITSMRFLSSIKWEELFEKLSIVENILKKDPLNVYEHMEFESRDYYRNQVEILAKKLKVAEIQIAERAIKLAKEADKDRNTDNRYKHVGYYLIDDGRKQLDNRLTNYSKNNYSAYLGIVSLFTFGLLVLFSYILSISVDNISAIPSIVILITVFVPILSLALSIINWLITHIVPPHHIPKYDFKACLPEKYKTMVIIPTLLTGEKQTRELIDQLEVFYLANNEENLHFAIVGDFKDSANRELPGEDIILDTAIKRIKNLNQKYAQDTEDLFFLFHRDRNRSENHSSWMGWERKRGAIIEFNRLLRGSKNTSFTTCIGNLSILPKIKYVITIDADTQLPRDSAKKLIGAMAHPLNHPILNKSGSKVIKGYGLIQPRIKVSVDSANSSPFSLIFSGQTGVDPYTTAVSDVYQDLFGEGIFTGKGIYDVDTFFNILDNAFPENSVLSHDLLEGSYVRTGLATDIKLIDGYPSNYIAHSMRLHRWVRGDWQLIPWLSSVVENAKGEKTKNPLDIIAKWKILDNMRRSLFSPTVFLSLIFGLIFFPNMFFLWFGFLLLTTGIPLLLDIVGLIYSQKKDYSMLKNSFIQFILSIIFLPYQAYLMADAILRTIFRVFFTRRNMLEWVTAADTEKTSKNALPYFTSKMWISMVIGVYFLFISKFSFSISGFFIVFLSISWLVSPWIAYKVSKPYDRSLPSLTGEQAEKLYLLAKNTWRYFERFVVNEDNWLPPDNYQEEPYTGVAHRTSPTNIGLYLVSVLSARDLGYIGVSETIERIEKTLGTMEKLDKWNGHFYNWYNTITLEPLKPMYISSVDSGNLAAYLITLKQGILEIISDFKEVSDLKSRCRELVNQIDRTVNNMDFKVLYDEKKELFSIGYNREEGQLTNSYYDLFASEARHTSFVAIAKGDIPQRHWFKLGRPLTMIGNKRALVSWSGTMFEYLMPFLIMKVHNNTLLSETYISVVKSQKLYGDEKSIPWGMSESGYYAFDLNKSFHYKAFGVPQLGLKRSLSDDLVVTPYASIMALGIDPIESFRNIEMLMEKGLYGHYGFYEAIDYTESRIPEKETGMIIKSYMAHHHGMSLLAINNFLNDNIMQRRFHNEPIIKATELLLQEKIPGKEIYIKEYESKKKSLQYETKEIQGLGERRIYTSPFTSIPEIQLLSNGTYTTMLTNSGGSLSTSNGIAINRWRKDTTKDNYGMYFYIHNLNSNHYWSTSYSPCSVFPNQYEVIFEPHRAIFSRKDGNIKTQSEIVVSPEYNGEIRSITLTNLSKTERIMEVTSYFETILTPLIEDIAHPAFNKLFLESEFLPEENALLTSRRQRDKSEKIIWLVHTIYTDGKIIGNIQFETDRCRFIGRGRDLSNPIAMEPNHPLSNMAKSTTDPIISLRRRVSIPPGAKSQIYFLTAVADSREKAIALAKQFQSGVAFDRAVKTAWTHNRIELDFLNTSTKQANLYQKMASHIIFQSPTKTHLGNYMKNLNKGQSGLWAYSISGDNPIVLIKVNSKEHIKLVEQMLKAHEYWKLKGLSVDLVFLNKHIDSYERPVSDMIRDLISVSHLRESKESPGGVFLIQDETLPEEDRNLLYAASRLILSGNLGSIQSQLKTPAKRPVSILNLIKEETYNTNQLKPKKTDLMFFNGLGGFSPYDNEYIIQLHNNEDTPMPWSNIISNPNFGFLVTETGAGYTWHENSRENKLTPWSNDPLIDPVVEIIYLRDNITGEFWSITPEPVRRKGLYTIKHGRGYSKFEYENGFDIIQEQLMLVPIDDPVKIYKVSLKNNSDTIKNMSLIFYAEWVLGVDRQATTPFIFTEKDEKTGALLAHNNYNEDFQGYTAFMYTNTTNTTITCDRDEFIGRRGCIKKPAALKHEHLSGRTGAGLDPCGALMAKVEIKLGEEKEIIFLLGQGKNLEEIHSLISNYKSIEKIENTQAEVKNYWASILDKIKIETPDTSFNLMMNNWLLYQSLACRIFARTAFYQAGGAFGFRDQLQDMMAIIYVAPEIVREHIILSAEHQFLEGDVQHWWHPPHRGVRTKITDDLLFLPYVTADYIEITGDKSILDEMAHFIEDDQLKHNEKERYNIPKISEYKADIYEHCILSIDKASQFGKYGLPLIGSGDWNDGMSSVGHKGKGESVWLGWFLYTVLAKFIPICKMRKDFEKAEKYEKLALQLVENIEKNGWDGGWYRRAYFDDGTPIGSAANEECKIDSISQSWSVISGAGRSPRVREAMTALEHYLIDKENGIMKLLTPPFDKGDQEPGYIKGYIPGVRENGAQYTHAAAWAIMAFAKLGEGDKALEYYHMINPINHTRTDKELMKYKVEPYVVSADVYANPNFPGQGGWTWYTGSSSWLYRVALESLLGFKKKADKFTIDPCIAKTWAEYSIKYNHKNTKYLIKVKNPNGVNRGVKSLYLDGKELDDRYIPMINDKKTHEVVVILGK